MKKCLSLVIALLMSLVWLTACQVNPQQPIPPSVTPTATPTPTPAQEPAAKPAQDRMGNALAIPDTVERILCMNPAVLPMLTDMGLADKIIAVDTNSIGKEGLSADLPAFDMFTPDAEKIVALEPDLVFASGMSIIQDNNPFTSISDMGVCIAFVPASTTIADIKEDILFVARAVGLPEEGERLVSGMEAEIGRLSAIGQGITDAKTVYFDLDPSSTLYSFGRGVFLNEMIELLGAANILADQEGWTSVSEETLLTRNPDVILTNAYFLDDPVATILSHPGWEVITAVKEEQVYFIDGDASSQSNHRIVKAMNEMGKAIYPDLY